MRNSIAYTAVLAALLTLGTVSTSFAEQPKSTTKDSSDMMKGKDMPMMDGGKMPMKDMKKEMSTMMKSCNTMMESMNKHMNSESPQGGSNVK
ncbi:MULTISPECIES: hypothetical protein [unclassified Pseudomonas]|uniref:hypothetical protein n=1 Tax=unclassified Pseudomonas TaxID=196821 RepID=UPI000C86E132|nr:MULTISPECIES: hypothetical protein [unclassified Pseudomonas]PMU22972.1 hypothetical protein C1X90_18055 [Pseudomonas sp. GP01-A9]PMU28554.1 hypothetical protein C1X88_17705 [Pseudomonas sp. GP01-A13]PMU38806.1 hypothetical protein C1X89_15260 [Pseudomonas sp. GP01-A8]PMU52424.1 hypothetical protein C1X85_18815 [Pseudomonas sp. GP01-A6]PMU54421.1 hypothetical protein C1X87_06320 [Pseudomonas sp. GP01-A14]